MLGAHTSYPRRGRYGLGTASTGTTGTGNTHSNTFLVRPRLPLRSYARPKTTSNILGVEATSGAGGYGRSKRLKSRKLNGYQKIDSNNVNKKKAPDYTDFAYREAVSKLKYLLAESYTPRVTPRKLLHGGGRYTTTNSGVDSSNPKINIESGEDTDDRSVASEVSHPKTPSGLFGNLPPRTSPYLPRAKTSQLSRGCSNLALLSRDPQSAPPELMSFIERQEDYIEQLERESQYCRDELTNLLGKVKEVVAENETLNDKNRNGFLKSVVEEYNSEEENREPNTDSKGKRVKLHKILEGPSIVFESRISELEAQLTQARVELRKCQEENQANLKRFSETGSGEGSPELKIQVEKALREKSEAEMKLEETMRSLAAVRDREADAAHKAKRTLDVLEQSQFEKTQTDAEMRRLRDELDRLHERLREAGQEASRRVAEERHQIERRYSQQVEQLSADVASHWDVASKSQLEAEKQRREMSELRRDLAQKQTLIDELKKELQNKISSMQSDLSQAVAEKDAAEQEISAAKLSSERVERQAKQEQNRLQSEINSYKQRLERADADLVHCRRENLRLSEQIASLEKEVNLNRMVNAEEHRTPGATPRGPGDNDKELTSMIMDIETKHATTVAGLEDALANQATVVSQLSVECQSLTQRLEANKGNEPALVSPSSTRKKLRTVKVDLKVKVVPKKKSGRSENPKTTLSAQEEMASLQDNLKHLTSQIQDSLVHQSELHPKYEENGRPESSVPSRVSSLEPETKTKDVLPKSGREDEIKLKDRTAVEVPRQLDTDNYKSDRSGNVGADYRIGADYEPTTQDNQNYDTAAHGNQNYDPVSHENQNYDSAVHQNQNYDPAAHVDQSYDPAAHEDQNYETPAHGNQNYDPASHENQNYDPAAHENQNYDPVAHVDQSYDPAYTDQSYGQYDQYNQEQYNQEGYNQEGGEMYNQNAEYNEQEYQNYGPNEYGEGGEFQGADVQPLEESSVPDSQTPSQPSAVIEEPHQLITDQSVVE